MGGLSLLYKQDVGGGETGPLSGSYETTFANTPTDPEDALIEYIGGNIPDMTENVWLLVKDGNQTPGRYAYDLDALGWNGTDDLDLQDFWTGSGAISHVAIYGGSTIVPPPTTVPPPNLPEPSSLLLLGLGLLDLRLTRR
jgi:hypothetical protein